MGCGFNLGLKEIYISGYRSGFYHDPVIGGFNDAFCQAVQENKKVKNQAILWSAEPGATFEKNAPNFKPITPDCRKDVWIWQPGRNAKDCAIDTNVADTRVLEYLW